MRRLIQEGRIGEVKAIWCRHFVGNGGDFYFKDWHAERAKTTSLLLQKGAHDLDVIHWLAGAYTTEVQAMGSLSVYGDIDDRRDRSGERMRDWFSLDNWPPAAQTGLNPVIDVEDISMVNLRLGNGVLASYQQCHFTPDYWRNYTVIGTEGRIENFGDVAGSEVRLWNRRHNGAAPADETFVVPEAAEDAGHDGADALLVAEFLRFVRDGGLTETSPVAAREAVAAGVRATESLRGDGGALAVPPLDPDLVDYFELGQVADRTEQHRLSSTAAMPRVQSSPRALRRSGAECTLDETAFVEPRRECSRRRWSGRRLHARRLGGGRPHAGGRRGPGTSVATMN